MSVSVLENRCEAAQFEKMLYQSQPAVSRRSSTCRHGPPGDAATASICSIGWPSRAGWPRWNGQPGPPGGGDAPLLQLVQAAAASALAL